MSMSNVETSKNGSSDGGARRIIIISRTRARVCVLCGGVISAFDEHVYKVGTSSLDIHGLHDVGGGQEAKSGMTRFRMETFCFLLAKSINARRSQ